jgi:hypothetical protein
LSRIPHASHASTCMYQGASVSMREYTSTRTSPCKCTSNTSKSAPHQYYHFYGSAATSHPGTPHSGPASCRTPNCFQYFCAHCALHGPSSAAGVRPRACFCPGIPSIYCSRFERLSARHIEARREPCSALRSMNSDASDSTSNRQGTK